MKNIIHTQLESQHKPDILHIIETNDGSNLHIIDRLFLSNYYSNNTEPLENETTNNLHIWPRIMHDILSTKMLNNRAKEGKIIDLINTNIMTQMRYLFNQVTSGTVRSTMGKMDGFCQKTRDIPQVIWGLSEICSKLQNLVEMFGRPNLSKANTYSEKLSIFTKQCYYHIKELQLESSWSSQICYIKYKTFVSIVPKPYLLMIYNKCCDILSVLITAYYMSGTSLERSTFSLTLEFLISGAKMSIRYPKTSNDIWKALEGICIGITLFELEGKDNEAFLRNMVIDMESKCQVYVKDEHWYQVLQSASVPLRHELSCLSKIFGHPFVDMEKGSILLYTRTNEDLSKINLEVIRTSVLYAKRSFIKSYIYKHGKWPKCIIAPEQAPRLSEAFRLNKDPECNSLRQKYRSELNIEEFSHVTLQKQFVLNKLDNFIPQLKDKTVSILRNKVLQHYNLSDQTPDASKIKSSFNRDKSDKSTRSTQKWTDTRLHLFYLLSPFENTDHIPYLEEWLKETELNYDDLLDYLIIRIVPKEKELKTLFRGFGCKTHQDRARTCVQEKNTSTYLDNYSKEQAMTLDEFEILNKLVSFRRIKQAYVGYTPIYVVVDSSAWNNYFRDLTVAPVMEETLDRLYGTKLWSRTMKAYEKSTIYVPDEDITYSWAGQLGGIEGQNQYTWDIVYLAQIHSALYGLGYPFHVFVKGDDLRIVIMIPPIITQTTKIEDIKNQILTKVRSTLEKCGHTINLTESYGSFSYFAFSKSASIGDIELPQTFRKIQKCYGANNAFLPFLDDYIASAFSNAHAACKTSTTFINVYVVALFWAGWHLTKAKGYKKLTGTELGYLLLIPSLYGGFPIIYLHNIFVRAESDLLTPFLGLMQYTKQANPECYDFLVKFTYVDYLDPKTAFVGLLVDPYSLPIKKPTSPATVLRAQATPALRKLTKNEDLKTCLDIACSELTESLYDILFSANVYNAKIMSVIYDGSPKGFSDQLTRKFESGRSILELMIIKSSYKFANSVIRRVIRADTTLHKYRMSLIDGTTPVDYTVTNIITSNTCPAEASSKLRQQLWGKPVESVTMPPLQHQLLISDLVHIQSDSYYNSRYFEITLLPPTKVLDATYDLPLYATGGKRPFVGFKTRTGLRQPKIHLIEKDEILIKVKNLLDLCSWTNTYSIDNSGHEIISNCQTLLKKMIKLYVDTDIENLAPLKAPRRSGTIQHHVRGAKFRESIVPNTLSNLYTHIIGRTNTHTVLRESHDHFLVNYLHILCHVVSILGLRYDLTPERYPRQITVGAATINCDYCNTAIHETPIVFDQYLLDRFCLPMVKILRLSQHAQDVIRESLDSQIIHFQSSSNQHTPVDPYYAQVCVVQELIKTTSMVRDRIQSYAYQHTMTSESADIMRGIVGAPSTQDVSLTELKSLQPKVIFDVLIVEVIAYLFGIHHEGRSSTLLSYLITIPSSEFPWTTLLRRLYESGKLGMLITHIKSVSQFEPTNEYINPTTASMYLVHATLRTIKGRLNLQKKIVYCSHYEPHDLSNFLERYFVVYKLMFFLNKIIPRFNSYLSSKLEGYYSVLRCIVVYWTYIQLDPECYESLQLAFSESGYNTVKIISLFDSDNLQSNPDISPALEAEYTFPLIIAEHLFDNYGIPFADIVRCSESLCDYQLQDDTFNSLRSFDFDFNVEVYFADITTCTDRVRQLPVHLISNYIPYVQPGTDELIIRETIRPNDPTLKDITFCQPRSGSTSTFPIGFPQTLPPIMRPNSVCIENKWAYRQYISGTTAINKLKDIFNILELRHIPSGRSHYVLADGLGGFSYFIAKNTINSNIVFNTLIDPDVPETPPHVLMDLIEAHNIKLDLRSSHRKADNLTNSKHVDIIMESAKDALFVLCDAQTVGLDMTKRKMLILSVLRIFLHNTAPDGILILKIYLNENSVNFMLIDKVITCCNKYVLIKPQSSGHNEEAYLVCWEKKGDVQDYQSILSSETYIDSNLAKKILIWRERLHQVTRYCPLLRGEKLHILSTDICKYSAVAKNLPVLWLINVQRILGVDLSVEDVTICLSKEGYFTAIRILVNKVETTITHLHQNIEENISESQFSEQTRAHKMQYLIKILALSGFHYILTHGIRKDRVEIDVTSLVNILENILIKYKSLAIIEVPINLNQFAGQHSELLHTRINPALELIKGVHIALQFYGFFNVLNKQ